MKIQFALIICIFLNLYTANALNTNNLPDAEACVVETCGQVESLPTLSAPITDGSKKIYEREIEPLVQKSIQKELMLHDLQIFLLKKFANTQPDRLSDDNRAIINFMYLNKSLNLAMPKMLKIGGISPLNESFFSYILKYDLKDLVPQESLEWAVQSVLMILKSEVIIDIIRLHEQPLEYILRLKYEKLSLQEALIEDGKNTGAVLKEMKNSFPIFSALMDNGELDLIQKIARGGSLSQFEKKFYLESRQQAMYFKEILKGGSWRKQLLLRPASINEITSSAYKSAASLKMYQSQSWALELTIERERLEAKCKANLIASIDSSPSLQEIYFFKKTVIPRAKSAAKSILPASESAVFDLTDFIFPKTKDERVDFTKDYLKKMLERLDRTYKIYLNLNTKFQEHQEAAFVFFSAQQGHDSYIALNDNGEFCDESAPEDIVDSTLAALNIIHIGWRSILYPKYGLGILAHEMGHVLSAAQEENPKIQNIMSCLSENQKGSKQFSEEDFADLFGSKIMAQTNDFANSACLLIPASDKFYYLNFDAYREDVKHSNGFLRLLAMGSYTRTLKPSCQKVAAQENFTPRWKDCWK